MKASSLTSGSKAAFTLLEVLVVLTIMSVLIGIAVVSFDGVNNEHFIRKPVSEFQRLTMDGVRRAGLYEKPQMIVFGKNGFALSSDQDSSKLQRQTVLPEGMQLTLQRFGTEEFVKAEGQRLVITPGGICEPLAARFALNGSWIEVRLDPLSGTLHEESMYIR